MACIISILDQNEWAIDFGGQSLDSNIVKTVRDWGLSYNAELTFNLGVFNMATGKGCTYVHSRKGDLGYGGGSDVLEINTFNKCKGYSNGIKNGCISINKPMGGSRTRNGIGITNSGKVILAQSSSNMTERSFCQKVNSEAAKSKEVVKLFVLQDGGGSTSSYSNASKLSFYPEGIRKVATVVYATRIGGKPITRALKLWCKGEDVKLLQTVLGGIEVDGSYGFGTRSRVIQAQRALGLVADGSCGPLTQKALGLR